VQRQNPIDTVDLTHQGHQFRLAPDDNLPRNLPERLGEPNELNGIPKTVIAPNKDRPVLQVFASPDPLLMSLAGVLDRAGNAILSQARVAKLPCSLEIVSP
jgi:hypothetical protein